MCLPPLKKFSSQHSYCKNNLVLLTGKKSTGMLSIAGLGRDEVKMDKGSFPSLDIFRNPSSSFRFEEGIIYNKIMHGKPIINA